jgi:hypothetical protein
MALQVESPAFNETRLKNGKKGETMMKAHLPLALALLLVCTGAAMAQTPDGETPAEETACDNETGAAFGLCNAYCEAMDCESDAPQASETACSKVRDKFTQITGRDFPCEAPAVTCPCNDPEVSTRFAGVVSGQFGIGSCTRVEGGISVNLGGPGDDVFSRLIIGQPRCGDRTIEVPISAEESLACAQLLEQAATEQGVTCN